jgi:NAD-dependent DNA ligase
MDISALRERIVEANYNYRVGTPIISDQEYDELVDALRVVNPDDDLLAQVGLEATDRKAELPIVMASMNKVKTITEIADWIRTKSIDPSARLVVTPKLDGVSMCVDHSTGMAYTRGDGKVGQVASMHYKAMGTGLSHGVETGRLARYTYGEVIMPKSVFRDMYSGEFANPRNLVSGLMNSKDPGEAISHCSFLRYGAVGHGFKTKSALLDALNTVQPVKVPYLLVRPSEITEAWAGALFHEWSQDYEIDGLILEVDDLSVQERMGRETSTNNPTWARALKHKCFETSEVTVVTNIEWNISKQGLLKPTINVEPVHLDGVVIRNVTGNNARYVKELGVGVGSRVRIVRSGMVIPVITEVLDRVDFVFPDIEGAEWAEGGVDIRVSVETEEQIIQRVVSFFAILEAKGISEGTIRQIFGARRPQGPAGSRIEVDLVDKTDFRSALSSILSLTTNDLSWVYRFGDKKAAAFVAAVAVCTKGVKLSKLQHALGLFRGLGSKKLEKLEHFTTKPTVDQVMSVEGFAETSARAYVDSYDDFAKFIEGMPITLSNTAPSTIHSDGPLSGQGFVFTGVRLPDAERKITELGGRVQSSVGRSTTFLVMRTKGTGSSKEQKAIELGVRIMDVDELDKYLSSVR